MEWRIRSAWFSVGLVCPGTSGETHGFQWVAHSYKKKVWKHGTVWLYSCSVESISMRTVQLAFDTAANRTVYNALNKKYLKTQPSKIVPCVMCGHLNLIVSRFPLHPRKLKCPFPLLKKGCHFRKCRLPNLPTTIFQGKHLKLLRCLLKSARFRWPHLRIHESIISLLRSFRLIQVKIETFKDRIVAPGFFKVGKNSCYEINIWWFFANYDFQFAMKIHRKKKLTKKSPRHQCGDGILLEALEGLQTKDVSDVSGSTPVSW